MCPLGLNTLFPTATCTYLVPGYIDTLIKLAGYRHSRSPRLVRGPWLFRASYGDGRASAKPSHSLSASIKFRHSQSILPLLTPNLHLFSFPRFSLPLFQRLQEMQKKKSFTWAANKRDRWPNSPWGHTLPTLPARMWPWPMIPRWPTPRR